MCELGQVSRAGFYRFDRSETPADRTDLDLRDEIQRIALEFPCYGRPRITAELQRRGWEVDHKRVGRIMREDNLLCLRQRKFVVTTDSNHNLRVYPNLAGGMKLTGIDQLWVRRHHLYPAGDGVCLSGGGAGRVFPSRDRLGAGSPSGRRSGDRGAGDGAPERGAPPGLTHHSDRGVQYASNDYTGLLKEHGVRISMSRSGNPYDNATCESFMKTLKYEEVYRQEYRTWPMRAFHRTVPRKSLQRQTAPLGSGLPSRRSSSNARLAPLAVSSAGDRMKNEGALRMRFFRHGGIYRSDVSSHLVNLGRIPPSGRVRCQAIERAGKQHALPIVRDEFRPAIPQRVARQHCPSPLHRQCQNKLSCRGRRFIIER